MENLNYKSKNSEKKIFKIMIKNQFLKVKNCLLELEKDFVALKGSESKDREVKIKREIEESFFKPIIVFTDDLDTFEQK